MTIKDRLVTFLAAGLLASSVAAHAQSAVDPDPNVAPSTAGEEAELPDAPANAPQISADPDPNVGPSTGQEEAGLPPTAAGAPQTAADPDPNLGPSTTGEESEIQSGTVGNSSNLGK
jgi:hypothetical protein